MNTIPLRRCRQCGATKFGSDPCSGCGAGLPTQTFKPRTLPISVKEHGFHALNVQLKRA